jgi:hypothetical protein
VEEQLQAGLGVVGRGGAARDVDFRGGEEEAHVAAGGRDDLVVVPAIDAGEVVGLEGYKMWCPDIGLHLFRGHVVAIAFCVAIRISCYGLHDGPDLYREYLARLLWSLCRNLPPTHRSNAESDGKGNCG